MDKLICSLISSPFYQFGYLSHSLHLSVGYVCVCVCVLYFDCNFLLVVSELKLAPNLSFTGWLWMLIKSVCIQTRRNTRTHTTTHTRCAITQIILCGKQQLNYWLLLKHKCSFNNKTVTHLLCASMFHNVKNIIKPNSRKTLCAFTIGSCKK